jgi:hypothetical protein
MKTDMMPAYHSLKIKKGRMIFTGNFEICWRTDTQKVIACGRIKRFIALVRGLLASSGFF